MQYLLLLPLLILSFSLFGQNQSIKNDLQNFVNDKTIVNSPLSICVKNLETGETILDENDELSIIPASTLKLITSATALEVFGKDFRFETKLGYRGILKDSTLKGDIIIFGGGDPTLGSSYFFGTDKNSFLIEWSQEIKSLGIKSVDGNIIADPFIYADQDVPQTWIWEDLGNYFGAAAQGIALYDNTFQLVFKTDSYNGGKTEILYEEPFIPNLKLQNQVRASNDNRDRAYVFGSPFDSFRIIKGTLPKGKEEFRIKASIPDPSVLLAFELKETLKNNGVQIAGGFKKANNYDAREYNADSIFFIWQSPPLDEIVKQLNNESINLIAEHLCKHIGLKLRNEGSTNAGIKAIKNFWKEKGINTDFIYLADGSGLSRANAISAKTLVDVLTYMNNESENKECYKNSIPVTGLQGTQKYYFQQSFLKSKARAKSGSMTRVRSFAGYMTTQNGTPIAFAIIVNNFSCKSFTMAAKMEKLMESFYREL